MEERYGEVSVVLEDDFVAVVEIHRPPDNFFDIELIQALADAYEALDNDSGCRAIVLCSEGKHFCAGADFARRSSEATIGNSGAGGSVGQLYEEALRLFGAKTPVIAAIQGAAVGGGLGLACSADFRIGCPEARFAANFARLGFHQGFGLSVTLPAIVGQQRGLELLYTGRRIAGEEAARIGLCDRIVERAELPMAAHALAAEIAASGPLAVRAIRDTMRVDLANRLRVAIDRELIAQLRLAQTADFVEGVRATTERRAASFEGS